MSLTDDPMIDTLSRYLDLNVFRTGIITSNLANIDTPGYRARDINFQQELERANAGLALAGFIPAAMRVQRLPARPDGNNVSLERETLLLAVSQMRFNAGVQLLRDEFKTLNSAIHEGGTS